MNLPKIFGSIFLMIFPYISYGQKPELTTKSDKAIEAYNLGIKNYSLRYFNDAEENLLNAISFDSKFIEAYLVLAEVYEDSNRPLKAIETYRVGLPVNKNFYPYGYIRLANLEYKSALYEEGLKSYKEFLELKTNNISQIAKAKEGIARCEFAIEAIKHPVEFKPRNLGNSVNSNEDEYWPSLSTDEKTLVITRLVSDVENKKNVQEDFFISIWNDTSWSDMKNLGKPLNTLNNEGAQSITGDGRYMVFTACNRADGIGRCDLYASVKEGNNWSVPKNLGPPVNSKYRETQPSISSDGNTMYFSSDRPGGKGNHDIWVSHKDETGKWSNPVNMGDSINTPETEMSPFIHQDNRSLYFSSDGHIGMGGYDLFISRQDTSGIWRKPVNLGYPINTNRDEMGLIVNSKGDKAYYSSDINEINGKDILVFDLPFQNRPELVTYMKGKVFDIKDKHVLKASFELIDLESGKTFFKSTSDSLTGEFLVSIPVNRNYLLNVSKKGYLFFSENFSLKHTFNAEKPYLKDVPLQPLLTGNKIVLRNVFFETDSYLLRKESEIELDKVVYLLKTNPLIRIEIGGHTDNTGSSEYNQKLSENRAKSVVDYLVSKNIKTDRIIYKGYGMNAPVASNSDEEGRSMNRRTEMKIID